MAKLGSKPGLERILALLAEMDNPHQKLKYVHVAGTNGKGSTSTIIADVLTQAGYRVGRFTSPHMHSYLERFTINGVNIDASLCKEILEEIETKVKIIEAQGLFRPTEFEVLTALAFAFFARQQVDLAVIEVGMGGTLDSTNVINPLVSVITSVDYDHTHVLGNSLAEIAANKAGIIKPEVPVVLGPIAGEALTVLKETAHLNNSTVGAPVHIAIRPKAAPKINGQVLDINIGQEQLTDLFFSLPGDFQLENLRCSLEALVILRKQGFQFSVGDIKQALSQIRIPGRLEVLSPSPLVIADAAHNPHGAKALNESLLRLLPGQAKVLVCGLVDDKDEYNVLKSLEPGSCCCIVTRPAGERGKNWLRVKDCWERWFAAKPVIAIEDIQEAVEYGLSLTSGSRYLLATGSFYVLDRVRRIFVSQS
ncbi:MAG: bifunctional folylpolyglutamate synthase/dihydrofolate synthase [Syntrophomonadaceae bacterium]